MSNANGKLRGKLTSVLTGVAVSYMAGAWLLIQIANLLLPAFEAPPWIMRAVIVTLSLGLPGALTIALIKGRRSIDASPVTTGFFMDRRVGFLIIGFLSAGLLLSTYANLRSPPEPTGPVSILIADFDNSTGSSLFTGVLEETLRIGLEVAPFVDVFSRSVATSILTGLPAMEEDFSTLTTEAASLIALRQGINLVIAGAVRRERGALTVSVRGIEPGEQQEIFSVAESARTDTEILNAIANVASRVRLALGDTPGPIVAGERETFAVGNVEAAASYIRAQELQINHRFREAVGYYEQAIDLDEDFVRAYAGLAITEQYLGHMDAAAQHWQEALARLDLLTERGRLRTLGNYFMIFQRDYDNALRTYEQLIELYPADNVAYNNLAVTAFQAMDFARALEVGRSIVERYPYYLGYRGNLALYAMYASNFEEAADVAEALLEEDSTNVYAAIVVSLTAAIENDLAGAEESYRTMAELGSFGRSVASEGLADLAIYRGDIDAAMSILDDAIEEEMENQADLAAALKRIMRAEALLGAGQPGRALDSIEAALPSAAGEPAVLVPAALMLTDIGEIGRAQAIAEQLSSETSRVQRAYASLVRAKLAVAARDYSRALEHTNAAIETADLWLARFIRGNVHLAAGSIEAAQADFEICAARPGEAAAVFLNDRPSVRYLRNLENAIASLDATR